MGQKQNRSQFVLDKELCDVSTAKSIRFISNNYETTNSIDPKGFIYWLDQNNCP